MALTDGINSWTDTTWELLKVYWQKYARMRRQTGHTKDMTFLKVDADFVRFIAADSLIEDDLDLYNAVCMDEGGEVFEIIDQVKDSVMFHNAWANVAIIRSLLRGLQYCI
jgi:hypothetical protein